MANSHDCETAAPAIRKQLGCDEPLPPEARISLAGVEIDRCPEFYLRRQEDLDLIFEMYQWRRSGILPGPGGYMDQPNKFVDMCNLLDQLTALKRRMEEKAAKRRARHR